MLKSIDIIHQLKDTMEIVTAGCRKAAKKSILRHASDLVSRIMMASVEKKNQY